MIATSQLIYGITPMASKRKTKKYPHLEKRTAHGSWFVDISVVPELRHFYDGKSRLRHSLGTKDLAKALVMKNQLLREIESRKAIADLSDFNPEASPSTAYSNALSKCADASPEALDGLADGYELEHDLYSASNQPVKNHPTYFQWTLSLH
jgi:hypothetical protein